MINGGLDIYGAHGLEHLQAFVERRGGTASETGVAAVQCLEGHQVQTENQLCFDFPLKMHS